MLDPRRLKPMHVLTLQCGLPLIDYDAEDRIAMGDLGFCLIIAGMPMPVLTEIAKLRLDSISFFLLLLLIGSIAIRWAWNRLAVDFEKMPVLSFKQSLGVTVLWGLLFLLVLTMISGARELMTPGAWERSGQTYQLANDPKADSERPSDERRMRIADVASHVQRWSQNNGRYPADLTEAGVPLVMQSPAESPYTPYLYLRPREGQTENALGDNTATSDPQDQILIREPNVFDDSILSVTVSGFVVSQVAGASGVE